VTRAGATVPLLALLLALGLAAAPTARAEEISCTTACHTAEGKSLRESVHASVMGCIDCHGGNPAAVGDKAAAHATGAGFKGKLAREDVPELCASCHSDPVRMHAYALPADQLIQYRTSVHGRALYERGETRIAVCSDCHGAHRILSATDPSAPTAPANQPQTCGRCHADAELMSAFKLSADTVSLFVEGVHGHALLVDRIRGAPSCTDCHGSHGAIPPGVGEIEEVCGRCHPNEKRQYQKSAHFRHDLTCTACHAAHDVRRATEAMYEGDEPGHCGSCHDKDEAARDFARTVADGRKELEDAVAETQRIIDHGKASGLWFKHEDVYRRESERTLVSVRSLTHALDEDLIVKHFSDGLAKQERTREEVEKLGSALRDRRILLSVLVLLLIMMTALLAMKLRAIRRLS